MVGAGLPLLVGLVHVALVAPHYFVGSFDDDASYILTAKGLLAGVGLTGRLPSGEILVGLYPPGYSALLAPLAWFWPHSFAPLRLLSVACYGAVFPLVWVWLRRRSVSPVATMLALLLLALGPPFATYASMVMAEAPFLVVLMLLLFALDRWCAEPRIVTWSGAAVVGLSSALIWLKQAGVGLVAGLVLWLAFGRRSPAGGFGLRLRLGRAAAVAGGVALTLVPVVVARLAAGIPLAGARYSQELGGYYQGGLAKRLLDVVPGSAWHLLSTAIPATLVPYLEPLPISGAWGRVWQVVSWQVTILVALGAVIWWRRHRDAAVPMAVVYLAESILWPFVNERRAILVLPLLVAWYVTGTIGVWEVVRRRAGSPRDLARLRIAGLTFLALAVAGPLLAQAPRDYLYGWGQSGSHFGGSRYVTVLRQVSDPSDVIETDYRSSVALFTGRPTGWTAFFDNQTGPCSALSLLAGIHADHAGFLLLGDVNKPGRIDNPCLQTEVLGAPWAVPLMHTGRDDASVYELLGPFTAHPRLADLLRGRPAQYSTTGTRTTLSWDLPGPTPINRLSVGEAAAVTGATRDVRLEVEAPGGRWSTVADVGSGVGDGAGRAPYLLARMVTPPVAVAVRVVVDGISPGAGAGISDVAALGPAGGSS